MQTLILVQTGKTHTPLLGALDLHGNICTRNNNGVLPPPPALIPCPIAPDGIVGTVNVDYGTMWSVGGRAGYLVSPTWLIYGLVAYSEVNVDVSASAAYD